MRSVVLPEPVAPLIRKLRRRWTTRSSICRMSWPNMPSVRSSSIENTFSRRIRILRRVPAVEIGGSTAWIR